MIKRTDSYSCTLQQSSYNTARVTTTAAEGVRSDLYLGLNFCNSFQNGRHLVSTPLHSTQEEIPAITIFARAYLARDLNRDLLQPKMVQFSYQFVWFRAAHCTF